MKLLALALLLAPLPLAAQSDTASALPTDPTQLLTMAAPLYDYTSPDMKPWHVRYHYQNFDQSGTLTSEGDFEYWSATTSVSKASWKSGDQSYLEWHTADGKELRAGTRKSLEGMDHTLTAALIPGFLKIKDSHSGDRPLKYFTTVISSQPVACAGSAQSSTVQVRPSTVPGEEQMQIEIKPSTGDTKIDSLDGASPGYCFDQHTPVLIASHEAGTITTLYGKNRKFQNHNFPGQFTISYVGAKRVVAKLEDLKEVHANDAAFTPSADATEYVRQTTWTVPVTDLVLDKSVEPVHPENAQGARIGGTVVVRATITKDGGVKEASVVSSPDDSLSAAALNAVRQWHYKPYTMNGQQKEVNTWIKVAFKP